MAKLNGQTPEQMAKAIVDESVEKSNAFETKVRAIAERLQTSYEQAFSLVEQEEKRREYGARYRQSEAYKRRLEQQRLVRQMMKVNYNSNTQFVK